MDRGGVYATTTLFFVESFLRHPAAPTLPGAATGVSRVSSTDDGGDDGASPCLMKWWSISIGSGKMMVEFFSAEMVLSVCR